MKLKAKLITAALVLLGTIVLSGCDYQINPRRGPYYPYYPYDKVFPGVPTGTYHFETAIGSCKYWKSNDGNFILSFNEREHLLNINNQSYGFIVEYTNKPMIVNIHLSNSNKLVFELTHAYHQSIKIINSTIPNLAQEFKGIID